LLARRSNIEEIGFFGRKEIGFRRLDMNESRKKKAIQEPWTHA